MVEVSCIYTAASVNRAPHCLAWAPDNDIVIFGSCDAISVAELDTESACLKITQTLAGHSARVNCVRWISSDAFVSASTDGTVRTWIKDGLTGFTELSCLKGHSESVTCVDGFVKRDESFLLASASADSNIKVWNVSKTEALYTESAQTIPIHRKGFALDIRIIQGPSNIDFIIASTDACKILIFCSGQDSTHFLSTHQLTGHEDWVQCLSAVALNNTELLIASGGQDNFVRLWKIAAISQEAALEEMKPVKDLGPEEEIRQKEEIFSFAEKYFSVSLESILAGHEDKVYGLKWQINEKNEDFSLLSCSLDKSMIVWKFDSDSGMWIETVRVGEVGGNTLGFLGCEFRLHVNILIGYNFNGALHIWKKSGEDHWKPGVASGGHYKPVEDLDWEQNGRYFVTVSRDQTTRIHAPWRRSGHEEHWSEVARPQVHGHDLACLTVLPSHRFASGAEEKIVRVFEGTKNFLQNLSALSQIQVDEECQEKGAQGASVPSLGLSNKAVEFTGTEVPKKSEKDRHVKDQYPDYYFTPEVHQQPPPEESLYQNSLWPELQKLYGHGYEIFSLTSDRAGKIIASSCKAAKAEHAQVFLWDAESWKLVERLSGHSLTIIQMEFSPCDKFLLTVSRDRTWSLFVRGDDKHFSRVAFTDKITAVHQRLIWSCSWSKESKYFCTASRDKKVAVWSNINRASEPAKPKDCLGNYGLACAAPLALPDAVTAVAFSPVQLSDGSYLLAAGLESGHLVFVSWSAEKSGSEQWSILKTLDQSQAHHKAVKRIRFSPACDPTSRSLLVATCSTDHSVKLFNVTI